MTEPEKDNKYKLFSIGAVGVFMATLDGSILNVALPTISTYFKASVEIVAWVVLSYSLTLVSLMMAFGAWAGKRGYFFAYKFGYIVFLLGSLICIFSNSIYMLIFARIVQGVGTAMFSAIGPAMVSEVFPNEERGKGIGMMMMMVSAGLMTGPPLGGFLLGYFSWQSIFIINIPIGFAGLVLTYKYFAKYHFKKKEKQINLISVFSISIAITTGIYVLSLLKNYELYAQRISGLIMVVLVSFAMFIHSEKKGKIPLIGFDLFKNKQFSISILSMTIIFISIGGVLILIPFYLEQVRNFDTKTVGMFLAVLPVTMFIIAFISGRLSDKIGFRFLTSLGVLTLSFGLYLLSSLSTVTSNMEILFYLFLLGAGFGIFAAPNSSALIGSVTDAQSGVVSGIMGTMRNVGMSIGIALSTALFAYFQTVNSSFSDANLMFVASYKEVIWVALLISIIAFPLTVMRKNRL